MKSLVPVLYSSSDQADPSNEEPKRKTQNEAGDMARQFHKHAQDDTPTNVSVPGNWPGILMWALGRHGPIVLFVVSTWLLYNDNKENQVAMLEVAKAQIAVNSQVVSQMTKVEASISEMVDELKKERVAHSQPSR